MASVLGPSCWVETQLITGYRGSADYVVAAVRGIRCGGGALPTTMRFRRGGQLRRSRASNALQHSRLPERRRLQAELDLIRVERLVAGAAGHARRVHQHPLAALAKALVDPVVVQWAAENDVVMKPKTPQEAVAILNEQRAFFEKWKPSLSAS